MTEAERQLEESTREMEAAAVARAKAETAWEASQKTCKAARDVVERERMANAPPVDRSNQELTDGSPVPEDRSHTERVAGGQQKGYVVLSPAERAKGFVRPVRESYRHDRCGHITSMSRSIAETYARDPFFYSGTFCSRCRDHFPVGADGEFVWIEQDGRDGSKVGT